MGVIRLKPIYRPFQVWAGFVIIGGVIGSRLETPKYAPGEIMEGGPGFALFINVFVTALYGLFIGAIILPLLYAFAPAPVKNWLNGK